MMSLSSSLAKTPLSKRQALGILLALFVGLFVVQTFVTRKDMEKMVKIFHSFYPQPVKQFVDSFNKERNKNEQQDEVSVDLWETATEPTARILSRESCEARSHIVFLKTHQTESSAIQNILYRYGESRGLTFALPENNGLTFSYPALFRSRFVEGGRRKTVEKFDIMCNEMRFQKSEVAKVMPEDTFYFSILRHPVLMMQSMFRYFKYVSTASDFHTLDKMIQSRFEKYTPSDRAAEYLFTNLTFDFGFDNVVTTDHKGPERASEVIDVMKRDFHLILINEYFDESLVLLKHALCWSLEDVATLRPNSRSDQPAFPVLPDTAADIRRWNALDWKIYQYFNATFWHKVESVVGMEEMKREVSELRQLQAKLTHTCLEYRLKKNGNDYPKLKIDWDRGDVSLGFNIKQQQDNENYSKCQKHVTPAVQFTSNLYELQFSKQARRKKQALIST